MHHGEAAPVLKTSAQLLSGPWDADTKQAVVGKLPESVYKLFTLRNACFHHTEQLCPEPQPKERKKVNEFQSLPKDLPRLSSNWKRSVMKSGWPKHSLLGTEFCTGERENGRRGITILYNRTYQQKKGSQELAPKPGTPSAPSGLGYWGSLPADEVAGFSAFDPVYLHDLLYVPAGIQCGLLTQNLVFGR